MINEVRKTMTTDARRPVGDHQNSLTAGSRGPIVFEDSLLFERMAHFNLERIPERVVHQGFRGPRTLRLHQSRHVQMDNRQAL
jgi:catalase